MGTINIEEQSATGNAHITNIGIQNINGQSKPPDKLLTDSPSTVDSTQFLHRDADIDALAEKIESDKLHVYITGFGGIGKTAIVRALYHKLVDEHKYEHVAWIDYSESLKESILDQANFRLETENPDIRWKQIKNDFTNWGNKLLIFVDNITPEDPDINWLAGLNAHLFVTSRLLKVHNFEKYEIRPLDKASSIDVFYCYYEHENEDEKEIVEQLVDLVSCHTLSIALLASIANSSKYNDKLELFLHDLHKESFGFSDLEIRLSDMDKELTIVGHLKKLFEIADLNDEQRHILAHFVIIPKGLQVPCEFPDWIVSEPTALEKLKKSRWISFSNKNGYVMHTILREAVKLQLEERFPDGIPYRYAEKMIDRIVSEDYFNAKDEHLLLAKKIQIADGYEKCFPDKETVEWSNFLNLLGIKYNDTGMYEKALYYLGKALSIDEKLVGNDHPNTARTYNNLARVYHKKGEYDKALGYFEKALDIVERCLGKDHVYTATTYNNIATVYCDKGKYDKALEYHEKALAIKEKCLGKNHLDTAIAYNNIAGIYQFTGNHEKALEYFKKTLDIKEKVLGENHLQAVVTYNSIATLYKEMAEHEKALEYYEKTLAIREKHLGEDHPDTATTYKGIADLYQATGEHDKALEFYDKALAIREKRLGKDHPNTATTYNSIATLHKEKAEYDKALEYYEKALAIRKKRLDEDHPAIATTYRGIANLYHATAEYDKALEYYDKALVIFEKCLGKDNSDTATTYKGIADLYQVTGENDKALEYYEKALVVEEKCLRKDNSCIVAIYNNIAVVYQDKGNYDKALEYYKKALVIEEKCLGKNHPSTAATYNNMGNLYKDKGEHDKAIEYFQKALSIAEKVLGKDHPNTITTYNNIAGVYQEKGACDKAREYAQKASKRQSKTITVVRNGLKVGRNALCPCGSGKKYKQCCGC